MTERGLRAVCDGLFTLAGVDWRGRPLAGAGATSQPEASPDPILRMIEVSRIALDAHAAALAAPDAMTPAGWARNAPAARAAREAWAALLTATPTTAAGVIALARHATDQAARGDGPEADDLLAVLGTIGAAILKHDPTPPGWPGGDRHADASCEAERSHEPAEGNAPGSSDDEKGEDAALILLGREFHALERAVVECCRQAGMSGINVEKIPGYEVANARRFEVLDAMEVRCAVSMAGIQSKAQVLLTKDLIEDPCRHSGLAISLAKDIASLAASKLRLDVAALAARAEPMRTDSAADAPSAPATPEPLFVALEAHRSAHCDWLATLEGDDDEAVQQALSRRDAAFKAVLAVRPMSDAGRLAYAKHVLFEFAQIGIGSEIPPDLVIEAARMLNGWWSVSPTAMPPVAIEPTGAEAALHAALDAHLVAYAHRLHSAVSAASDADARADEERRAFRTLLHMPLGTDGARVAYATAILGQACSVYGAECDALDRSSPLPTAYRNLAFGQHAPEPQAPALLAAE